MGVHPPLDSPGYGSTALRHPKRDLVLLPQNLTEVTGPMLGADRIRPGDDDLTHALGGEAQGQRIRVFGRVLDSDGRPVRDSLVEVWQANAAGRYRHAADNWDAPLDPHFTGVGRVLTDADGRYGFTTVKPGAYPWRNHHNAWRPAHIHFSLFGRAFTQRLVTQMYFPDDPLIPYDPVLGAIPDPAARERLVSRFSLAGTTPMYQLAFEFDIVLRGPAATPMEAPHDD
ncbi:protocatechuate 3,4-dioxygenase subunit beta [Luedemannella flava]